MELRLSQLPLVASWNVSRESPNPSPSGYQL
jgi:hypothetical protein